MSVAEANKRCRRKYIKTERGRTSNTCSPRDSWHAKSRWGKCGATTSYPREVVRPTGIEPVLRASETRILSVGRRSRCTYFRGSQLYMFNSVFALRALQYFCEILNKSLFSCPSTRKGRFLIRKTTFPSFKGKTKQTQG